MDINAAVGSLAEYYLGISSMPACTPNGEVCPAGFMVVRMIFALLPIAVPVALSSMFSG